LTGIVDAHHHLWRRSDLPWLQGPMVPRIFGPYEPIRRDYLAAEYIAEAEACGVTASVYVQTNWPLERSVEEVRWVRSVQEETGWPSAMVACADLFAPDAAEQLRAVHEAGELVSGIRLQLHWHEREEYRFAAAPDSMNDPVFRGNLARLADYGWIFELQVFPGQFDDALRLVEDFPALTFVLVHAGMPEGPEEAHLGPWRAGLARFAEQPNVVAKLTGQGTFVRRLDTRMIEIVAAECLARFGADRCLWGSNFPVEKLWTDYPSLVGAWLQALEGLSDQERSAVLSGTARRVYRLEESERT
jgi:predicted TIM-barrel fold metal-dependent hydrolase